MEIARSRKMEVVKVLHDDKWISAQLVDVKFDNGKEIKNFLTLTGKGGGFVSVCARLPNGNFLLTEQCKPVAGLAVESVAGGREGEENWEEAARREMIEEVGYVPGRLSPIGERFYPMSDRADNPCHLFLAFDCEPASETKSGDEVQGVRRIILTSAEVLYMIASGEISDLATVAGVLGHFLAEKGFDIRRWEGPV